MSEKPDTHGLKVDFRIEADDVNSYIAKAVLESKLGVMVKDAIEKTLADLTKNYNAEMTKTVERAIKNEVDAYIHQELGERVKEFCRAKLTDDYVKEIVSKAWDRVNDRW